MIRYGTTTDRLELYGDLLEELGPFVQSDAEAEREAREAARIAAAEAAMIARWEAEAADGDDDDDPDDGAPAAALPALSVCPDCEGDGIGRHPVAITGRCWYCDGAGVDLLAAREAAHAAEARLVARQRRLAAKAEAEGVLVYAEGSRWYATSRSQPGARHRVTACSCTCRGFIYTGECGHHSLLLARLGWLDQPVAEPAAVAGSQSLAERLGARLAA